MVTGYILDCDFDIDESKHDYYNCLPLAPTHLTVTPDMLSPYAQHLLEKNKLKHVKTKKLVHYYVVFLIPGSNPEKN